MPVFQIYPVLNPLTSTVERRDGTLGLEHGVVASALWVGCTPEPYRSNRGPHLTARLSIDLWIHQQFISEFRSSVDPTRPSIPFVDQSRLSINSIDFIRRLIPFVNRSQSSTSPGHRSIPLVRTRLKCSRHPPSPFLPPSQAPQNLRR